MSIHHLIETGNKLELVKIRRVADLEEEILVSSFLYRKSTDEAVIVMPTRQGVLKTLEIGENFMVTFYTNKGLYKCQVEVIERFYEDDLPVAGIRFQSDFEKLQRRQYYRMECLSEIQFRVVSKAETERIIWAKQKEQEIVLNQNIKGEEVEFLRGIALDISGGGIRFNTSTAIEPGRIILVLVPELTDNAKKIKFLFARVLRNSQVQNRSNLFDHRVEFVLISNEEREMIIRYIFQAERNKRKKDSANR